MQKKKTGEEQQGIVQLHRKIEHMIVQLQRLQSSLRTKTHKAKSACILKSSQDIRRLINDRTMEVTTLISIIKSQKDHIKMFETHIEKEEVILNNMESLLREHRDKMNLNFEQKS